MYLQNSLSFFLFVTVSIYIYIYIIMKKQQTGHIRDYKFISILLRVFEKFKNTKKFYGFMDLFYQ